MRQITAAQYQQMGDMFRAGHSEAAIARRLGVNKKTVDQFLCGQSRNPVGMRVFEAMTRPEGITQAQHEAWLGENGYRGFQNTP